MKAGAKFYLRGSYFPYFIESVDELFVTYRRVDSGYQSKRVYKYVFENDVRRGAIEFIKEN